MPFNFSSLFNFRNSNSRSNNNYSYNPFIQNNQHGFQPNMGWGNNYGYNQNSQNNQVRQIPYNNQPNQSQNNQARQQFGYNQNSQNIPYNQNNQQSAFNNKAGYFNNQMNFLNSPPPNNPMNFLNNQQPNNQMNFLNNVQPNNQMNVPNNHQPNNHQPNNHQPNNQVNPFGNLLNAFNPNQPPKKQPEQQPPQQKFSPFQQPPQEHGKEMKLPQIPQIPQMQHAPEKKEPPKKAQEASAPPISYDKLPVFRPLDGEIPIPEKKYDKPSKKASFDSNQLKQFIQNEKNGSKFYENMANEINDPEARRMFFSFSNKCNEHKKVYSDILTSLNNERFEPEDRKVISDIKFYDGVSLAIKEELESLKNFSTLYDSKLDSEDTKNKLMQIMLDKLIRINYMQFMSR